jgi:hypothetical protein
MANLLLHSSMPVHPVYEPPRKSCYSQWLGRLAVSVVLEDALRVPNTDLPSALS